MNETLFKEIVSVLLPILILVYAALLWNVNKKSLRANVTLSSPDWEKIEQRYPGVKDDIRRKGFNGVVKLCMSNISGPNSLEAKDEGQRFYIAFERDFPGVLIPQEVEKRFSGPLAIISLQYQFKILAWENASFSVELLFAGKKHPLNIPFDAIRQFGDPSLGFMMVREKPADW